MAALKSWLLSITAFRVQTAGKPWTFYDEIDRYLGPWGNIGYPIAYGKKYCVLFSTDERLNADPVGRAWICRTLLLLQGELNHPKAYTEGGLTMVVMLSPRLAFHVATIPGVEFIPSSDNFGLTWKRVFVTMGLVAPRGIGLLLAMTSGPAHTGFLGHVMAVDRERLTGEMNLGMALIEARRAVSAGRCDNVAVLDRLNVSVSTTELPNSSLEALAKELISAITLRRTLVLRRYQREGQADPELRNIFRMFDGVAP